MEEGELAFLVMMTERQCPLRYDCQQRCVRLRLSHQLSAEISAVRRAIANLPELVERSASRIVLSLDEFPLPVLFTVFQAIEERVMPRRQTDAAE